MNKFGQVGIVIAGVIVCYLIMLALNSFIVSVVSTANTTASAGSGNFSAYYGAQDFLLSIPWIMWFIPATIGTALVVWILKQPE